MSQNKQKIQLHTSIKLSLTSNRAINMVVSATERSEPIFSGRMAALNRLKISKMSVCLFVRRFGTVLALFLKWYVDFKALTGDSEYQKRLLKVHYGLTSSEINQKHCFDCFGNNTDQRACSIVSGKIASLNASLSGPPLSV